MASPRAPGRAAGARRRLRRARGQARGRRLQAGGARLSARARHGRRGAARLPRGLRLRRGFLGVGDPRPGRDRSAPREPDAAARPGLLPRRQHLLARQREPVQGTFRRRLRPADPRLQGARRAREPRPQGLSGGRGVRALGILPAGAADVARRRPQGPLQASRPRRRRRRPEGRGRHGGRERRASSLRRRSARCAGTACPATPRRSSPRSPARRPLLRQGGALARPVRLRNRRARRPAGARAAALLQHPVAAAEAHAGGEAGRPPRRPRRVRWWT